MPYEHIGLGRRDEDPPAVPHCLVHARIDVCMQRFASLGAQLKWPPIHGTIREAHALVMRLRNVKQRGPLPNCLMMLGPCLPYRLRPRVNCLPVFLYVCRTGHICHSNTTKR